MVFLEFNKSGEFTINNKSTVYLLKMLKNFSFLFITYEVRTNLGHSVGTSDNFFKVLHASLDYKTVDMSKRASFEIFCFGKYQKEVNIEYFFGIGNIRFCFLIIKNSVDLLWRRNIKILVLIMFMKA